MIDDNALGQRWLISGLAIVIASALYSLLQPFAGPASQLPFLLAIALVAVVSGRWPAMLVLAAGLSVALWRVAQGSSPLPEAWLMRVAILLGYWALGTLIILIADSARRHAQESHRARVEFDRVMAAVNVGTWHYDYGRRSLTYSANIGPMLGRPAGFVHGSLAEWRQEIHPDDQAALHAALRDASRDSSYETRHRIRTEAGAWRWMLVRGRIARDAAGRMLHADGVVMDITGARNAEIDLQRSSQELRTLLDLIPAGVAIAHDAKGDQITVSPRFARMLGLDESVSNASYTGEQHGKLPYLCMRDGVEVPGEQLPMQVAARSGLEVHDVEFDLLFDDQRVTHLIASAAPLFDGEGGVRGAIGVHTDITALKTAQRELERMDRQKDVFLATLAHELRNPLAPIGYAAAMLRRNADPAAVVEASRIIERQSAQMRQLLDELLDMSRVTRNVIELRREPVDLGGILRNEVEALQAQLDEHHKEVVVHCDSPAWVMGDETRLHQIIGNLLSNASKYTRQECRIEVELQAHADDIVLRVRDDGIGIAPEDLPRVFELFAQIHKPGHAPSGGLGIGLAVVRRLVELHGGQVNAHSAGLGKGTEFVVLLPRLQAACPAAEPDPSSEPVAPRAGRILVCDDNIDAADTLAQLLQMYGFAVQVTYDGASARRVAEAFRPDAAVLDLGLADVPGEDVARWMRAQPWGHGLLLIAVTGWGQDEDRRRTSAAGFDHHLVKPVDPDELLQLLTSRVGLQPGE